MDGEGNRCDPGVPRRGKPLCGLAVDLRRVGPPPPRLLGLHVPHLQRTSQSEGVVVPSWGCSPQWSCLEKGGPGRSLSLGFVSPGGW